MEVWPDEEEVAAQSSAAMHAVDSCNSCVEMDMSAAMQTIDTAARAAAIAHSQVGNVTVTTVLVLEIFLHAVTANLCRCGAGIHRLE